MKPETALRPFDVDYLILGRFRRVPSVALLIGSPLVTYLLLVIVNSIQGTLTTSASGWNDVRYALRLTEVPPPSAPYPLLRDYSAIAIFTVVALTLWLVHVQWRRMEDVVPDLVKSRAINPDPNNLKVLYDLVAKANSRFVRHSNLGPFWVFLSGAIMFLIILGEQRFGIFEVIADRSLTESDRLDLALQTYESWWASMPAHPAGAALYFFLGTVGIYVILLQNAVGFACIELIWGLRKKRVEFGIDLFDGDGAGGWSAVGRVLTTVYSSLLLHGFGISLVLFIVMGRNGWPFALALLAIWVVVAPTYVFLPLWVFRHEMRRAKEAAVDKYLKTAHEAMNSDFLVKAPVAKVVFESIARDGAASIRRIRAVPLRRAELYGAIVGQVLPISAVALEIYFTVSRSGSSP